MRKIGAVVVCALLSAHCTSEGCPTGLVPSGSMCVAAPDAGVDAGTPPSPDATRDAFVVPDAYPCGSLQRCGESCVDFRTDRTNCGGCNVQCDFLEECNAGMCNQPVALLQSPENDAIVAIASTPNGILRCVAGNAHAAGTWTVGARSELLTSPLTDLVECTLSDGSVIASIRAQTNPAPGSAADGDEGIHDIALTNDKTYIVGATRGMFQIQDHADPNTATSLDGFIAELHPDGRFSNARVLDGGGDASVEAVAAFEIAGTGTTVCYGGWFTPYTHFDGPIGTNPWVGGRDAFITCNFAGNPVATNWWFGAAGDDAVTGLAIVGDALYVVGHLSGSIANIGQTPTSYLTGVGDTDAFILRISLATTHPNFGMVWGSAGPDRATDIAINGSRIAVTGHCAGPISFDRLSDCGADQDGFLIVLNDDGTMPVPIAGQLLRSPFADSYESVALGTELFATGYIGAAANAETLAIAHAGADGTRDAVVTRYMSDGRPVSALSWGSTGNESGNAIHVTAAGVVSVGGAFDGAASIAGTPLTPVGQTDGFLVQH